MQARSVLPLSQRRLDLALVACFCVFAFTSLVMEMYIVFGVDLRAATDPFGSAWRFYAQWDPLFFDTPLWLRIMCGIDGFVFGPFYLVLIWAFVRGHAWIRIPALLYVSAIVYSTLVYFGYEFVAERERANLAMVVLVNVPYTIVPIVLGWRVRARDPFAAPAALG
ncbi:hypothetical protein DB30_00688 [Enhygromyxa salina]|uniref:EXPERA domain-containing protein n=1 Tax=Enhygromyxa salina TaxID=215803 RepID=A0A0C2A4S5_9BACT|nr:emopamil-binding family protein [Enhygromyxa salina]KIG18403.1 hypothetical protein DB30_00688 [Enhygromyxa salina]